MKSVFFLCHSRYTIFIAYFIKKIYHEKDNCTLIVSDWVENNEILGNNSNKLWDEVILLEEKNREPLEVQRCVKQMVEKHGIDVFYISHIMKCASHFFSHYLDDETEVNLIDEGIISLDLYKGYKHFSRKGLPLGWMDFSFNRIDNFYVLYPQITRKVGKAVVKKIDLKRILKEQLREVVEDLNKLFCYQYIPIEKKILFIDSDMANQGYIAQEYENHCIDNVMCYLDTEECIVKIKPSLSDNMLKKKYGKYNLTFMTGGDIPFEIIYLNCLIHGDMIPTIIALPTTLIWNVILINDYCEVANCRIVSLSEIMYSHFFYDEDGKDMLRKLYDYQSCFREGYGADIPKTWNEFFNILYSENKELFARNTNNFMEEEYNWEVEQNRMLCLEKDISSIRYNIVRRWFLLESSGISINQYFYDKGIKHIILYGKGVFGELLMGKLESQNLTIDCVIVSYEKSTLKLDIPVYWIGNYREKVKWDSPILITAVGKEKEVIETINEYNLKNEILSFPKIINYLGKKYL